VGGFRGGSKASGVGKQNAADIVLPNAGLISVPSSRVLSTNYPYDEGLSVLICPGVKNFSG